MGLTLKKREKTQQIIISLQILLVQNKCYPQKIFAFVFKFIENYSHVFSRMYKIPITGIKHVQRYRVACVLVCLSFYPSDRRPPLNFAPPSVDTSIVN